MKEFKIKVDMTFKALYSYIMNANYTTIGGILGLFLSFGALVILITSWGILKSNQKVVFIIIACLFTIINPLTLAYKTFRQLKLNVSYKKPLIYVFSEAGISISQEEISEDIEWVNIWRLSVNKHMLAVYTSRIHAFVIPIEALGEDKDEILSMMVKATSNNVIRLSSKMKRYKGE